MITRQCIEIKRKICKDLRFSVTLMFVSNSGIQKVCLSILLFGSATGQTGCYCNPYTEQSIHLREKQKQVLPCEIKKALAFLAHRKDLRFSMKMMFTTDYGTSLQLV